MNPEDLQYTKEHEWLRVAGDTGTVGITHYAQDELGDVVFVELPKVGAKVEAGKPLGTIESVKAVSEIFSPVSGEVLEVNTALVAAPETVNADPYGKGWLVRIRMDKQAAPHQALMSAEQYTAYTAG
jgi:glycine cleavage system H protein